MPVKKRKISIGRTLEQHEDFISPLNPEDFVNEERSPSESEKVTQAKKDENDSTNVKHLSKVKCENTEEFPDYNENDVFDEAEVFDSEEVDELEIKEKFDGIERSPCSKRHKFTTQEKACFIEKFLELRKNDPKLNVHNASKILNVPRTSFIRWLKNQTEILKSPSKTDETRDIRHISN